MSAMIDIIHAINNNNNIMQQFNKKIDAASISSSIKGYNMHSCLHVPLVRLSTKCGISLKYYYQRVEQSEYVNCMSLQLLQCLYSDGHFLAIYLLISK